MAWNLHVALMLAVVLTCCGISEFMLAGNKAGEAVSAGRFGR